MRDACAACHEPICSHPDAIYSGSIPAAGVVTVDSVSPVGSWDRALRHRAQIDAARSRIHNREVPRG